MIKRLFYIRKDVLCGNTAFMNRFSGLFLLEKEKELFDKRCGGIAYIWNGIRERVPRILN